MTEVKRSLPPIARPSLRALAGWFASAIGAALLLVLAALIAPHVPVAPLFAFVIGFAAVATSMVTTALAVPLLPRGALAGVLLAIAALVLVYALGLSRGSSIAGAAVVTCALLLGASCVGSVVAGGVEDPGHLLIVAVVFTLVDTFSVFHQVGPTAAIVENETLISLVALPWPQSARGPRPSSRFSAWETSSRLPSSWAWRGGMGSTSGARRRPCSARSR